MRGKTEFVACAAAPQQFPLSVLPEWALVGRSNVGKSSLLNHLVCRRRLAYVSKKPGRTRTINFYEMGDRVCLVDTPGYGFARVDRRTKNSWDRLMVSYFEACVGSGTARRMRGVLQLIDFRHPPMASDRMAYEFLSERYRLSVVIVATKSDRVSKTRWGHHIAVIRKTLVLSKEVPVLPFSVRSSRDRESLWCILTGDE
ncbi:ribosome biogenesis GTP-binding protein YihA/YsxC [Pasteuria penetrans]|uniref:ribosome biogenesis GTP-binding protein YihA/YsxC n=1 Tax=Pasteuria penetrans TaxID=86005 RepID=UPI0011F03EB0|nr:ribosome biogenesis GTP-binding protein YihA/YsxC [Pasteuria penetrans]